MAANPEKRETKSSKMSVSASLGPGSLLQLGISLSDVSLMYDQGRKIGNWFRAKRNDEELFESIMEDPLAILRRKGLVNLATMETRWHRTDFIYQGRHIDNPQIPTEVHKKQDLSSFSWLMVAIITALDPCLSSDQVRSLVINAFVEVLDNDTIEDSLRVQLPISLNSWREVGRVRGMARHVQAAMVKCRCDLVKERAVPQLNEAEFEEMKNFLVWLLGDQGNDFKALSATTFAVAYALGKARIHLSTNPKRRYPSQPIVSYIQQTDLTVQPNIFLYHSAEHDKSLGLTRSNVNKAQQISYPYGQPEAMIQSTRAQRDVVNVMEEFWKLGEEAGAELTFSAEAILPFHATESEIFYHLKMPPPVKSRFEPSVWMLAHHAFPARTENILQAVYRLIKEHSSQRLEWLQRHTQLEFLLHTELSIPSENEEDMNLWLQYQALVFGFYYKLIAPLVCLELAASDAYFRGLWGYGSTTFLAMCTQFSKDLEGGRASRTHMLYMLATMFNGRQKIFNLVSHRTGLLGIVGTISVLVMPLIRPVDTPQEIASLVVLDLPVADLMSDSDDICPHGPRKEWSVHAKMGMLFGDGQSGVVMAARCGGRLVGWFSPLAADVQFLSSAYEPEDFPGFDETPDCIKGFEISDEDWQSGYVQTTGDPDSLNQIGVVHSKGCPALRYAATGFYVSAGDEVAIAGSDVQFAVARVEGQSGGIVIT